MWDEIGRIGLPEECCDISTIIACLSAKPSHSIRKLDLAGTLRVVHSLEQEDYLYSQKRELELENSAKILFKTKTYLFYI